MKKNNFNMKYFFDTEFSEYNNVIDFISIGIISEDGDTFYAESINIDEKTCNDWVKENVLSKLKFRNKNVLEINKPVITKEKNKKHVELYGDNTKIKEEIIKFITKNPTFYAYYADYDWVCFCKLFGSMINLPKDFPMFSIDIKQMMEERNLDGKWKDKHCPDPKNEHNALSDAKWNLKLYNEIIKNKSAMLKENNISTKDIQVHKELNPDFFDSNNKLIPEVRKVLLDLANKYLDINEFEFPLEVKDIVFTGSLANYNYNEKSDVDIHIIVDYNTLGDSQEMIFDYFISKKNIWRDTYDEISIYGYPVEIFISDSNKENDWVAEYSLVNDEWVKEPKDTSNVVIDKEELKKMVYPFVKKIDDIVKEINQVTSKEKISDEEFNNLLKKSKELSSEIITLRQKGLQSDGEFAKENLLFKLLRNNNMLKKLKDAKIKLITKKLSLDEDFLMEEF